VGESQSGLASLSLLSHQLYFSSAVPRDVFPHRGRAFAEENRNYASPSFDGEWRVWKKSDPATTGAYDRESVAYIVNSLERKKYWHFFKHMLLGSEEHYYIRSTLRSLYLTHYYIRSTLRSLYLSLFPPLTLSSPLNA
jgi:hypothetical protein